VFPLALTSLTENKDVAQLLLSVGSCPRYIFRPCVVDFHVPYKFPCKEPLNKLWKFLETEKKMNFGVPNLFTQKIQL
uniref:Uncharacterized protein n=1 Tax=Castor canadensis TaxID=51338 RepID=A0A8C0VYI6_CASCN